MNEKRAICLCIRHRDPAGFEYLFRTFRKEAYYHAMAFLGNNEDAVDACQECFSKAFQSMPKLKALKAFYPWFYTLLRNHCLNVLKKRKTVATHAAHAAATSENHPFIPSPAVLAEKGEEKVRIWLVLECLSPEFREILMMKYLEGLSYLDIASLLKIPRGTVMSRLYNARKAFKQKYIKSDIPNGGY